MNVEVQKYGGSSLADDARLDRVARRVEAAHRQGRAIAMVVSARGDTTDRLLEAANQLREARHRGDGGDGRELDQLLATGECASAALMAVRLRALGVPATSLTGAQAGIDADGPHGAGTIRRVDDTRLKGVLAEGGVPVVAGFQGVARDDTAVTLGRGGSDTTAVALATQLRARRCEINTDVDGVFTADPRRVPAARLVRSIDPAVMAELSFAGAAVLHSRAVELAAMQRVELHVRSTFAHADAPGTVVRAESDPIMLETSGVVTAVACDDNVARVLVRTCGSKSDLAAEVLTRLAERGVPADLVARSGPQEAEFRMGFTVRARDADAVTVALRDLVDRHAGVVRVDRDVAKVSLIGMGLLNRPEHTSQLLSALAAADIHTSWVSMSQLRTSVVVPREQVEQALALAHHTFGLEHSIDTAVSAVT